MEQKLNNLCHKTTRLGYVCEFTISSSKLGNIFRGFLIVSEIQHKNQHTCRTDRSTDTAANTLHAAARKKRQLQRGDRKSRPLLRGLSIKQNLKR